VYMIFRWLSQIWEILDISIGIHPAKYLPIRRQQLPRYIKIVTTQATSRKHINAEPDALGAGDRL
jgi:hypothetical protein